MTGISINGNNLTRAWSEDEDKVLRELWGKERATEIANRLGRVKNSIIGRARRIGLPLTRRPNGFQGLWNGSPRADQRKSHPKVIQFRFRQPAIVRHKHHESEWKGTGVSIIEVSADRCKAIVGQSPESALIKLCCNDPIVPGGSLEFCEFHMDIYTTLPRERCRTPVR